MWFHRCLGQFGNGMLFAVRTVGNRTRTRRAATATCTLTCVYDHHCSWHIYRGLPRTRGFLLSEIGSVSACLRETHKSLSPANAVPKCGTFTKACGAVRQVSGDLRCRAKKPVRVLDRTEVICRTRSPR